MRQHVLRLARKHKIMLGWLTDWTGAESFPDLRYALVPEIRSAGDYLVALHELGHIVDKTARRHDDDYSVRGWITTEGAAWAWAAEHADPVLTGPLTEADTKVLADCWLSNMKWGLTRPTDYSGRVEGSGRFSHEPPSAPVRHSAETGLSTPRNT